MAAGCNKKNNGWNWIWNYREEAISSEQEVLLLARPSTNLSFTTESAILDSLDCQVNNLCWLRVESKRKWVKFFFITLWIYTGWLITKGFPMFFFSFFLSFSHRISFSRFIFPTNKWWYKRSGISSTFSLVFLSSLRNPSFLLFYFFFRIVIHNSWCKHSSQHDRQSLS